MASADSTRTRRELARVIFSRLVGMIVIVVVLPVVVVAAAYLSPWRYRSKALLRASPISGLGTEAERATLRERLSLFVVMQRELLLSDRVVAQALMQLDKAPTDPVAFDGKNFYKDAAVNRFVQANAGRVVSTKRLIRVETPGGAAESFTQVYTVTVEWAEDRPRTQLPSQESRQEAADNAQRFARRLLDAYMFRRSQIEQEQTKKIAEAKQKIAVTQTQAELDAAVTDLTNYIKGTSDIKGIGSDLGLVQAMLSGIGGDMSVQNVRTTAELRRDSLNAQMAGLQALKDAVAVELKKPAAEQVVVPTKILKANPSMIKLTDAIAQGRMELNRLNPQYTEDYKTVRHAKAELAANIADLRSELQRQATILDQNIAEVRSEMEHHDTIITTTEAKLKDLAVMAAEYDRLKQRVATLRSVYEKRKDEASQAAKQAALAVNPLAVWEVDAPSPPDVSRPHRPLLLLNLMIGLLAGLVLALTYVFLADHLDHSVKGIGDVERHVGVQVLTSIPKIRTKIIRTR